MDVKYINPFIQSLMNTVEMMLGVTPAMQAPYVKEDKVTQGDITGIIGFAERNITGSVALSFPSVTALNVYEMMTGEAVTEINRDVQDSIGELANIVAGGAKTELAKMGLSFHISIPSVIVGKNHAITHKV
ncbi:chemotaxis protein CheX, partial [bacterium]|nr:chemotaxis protein CheX [bacterium]